MKTIFTKTLKSSLLALGCLFLLNSCLKEEAGYCDDGQLSLRFSYILNPYFVDRFADEVQNLDIYVYNEAKELVHKQRYACTELNPGRSVKQNLPQGVYTVVVWGNYETQGYRLSEGTTYEQMQLSVISGDGGEVQACSSLYHGLSTFRVTGESQVETIAMIKNTNDIHVILEGIADTKTAGEINYAVRISGSNGVYEYNNNIAPNPKLNYMPAYSFPASDQMQADFTTLRIMKGGDLMVTITDLARPDNPIFDESLVDILMKQDQRMRTDEDFDRYDDHELRFGIRNNALVLISVNGWDVDHNTIGV